MFLNVGSSTSLRVIHGHGTIYNNYYFLLESKVRSVKIPFSTLESTSSINYDFITL